MSFETLGRSVPAVEGVELCAKFPFSRSNNSAVFARTTSRLGGPVDETLVFRFRPRESRSEPRRGVQVGAKSASGSEL